MNLHTVASPSMLTVDKYNIFYSPYNLHHNYYGHGHAEAKGKAAYQVVCYFAYLVAYWVVYWVVY